MLLLYAYSGIPSVINSHSFHSVSGHFPDNGKNRSPARRERDHGIRASHHLYDTTCVPLSQSFRIISAGRIFFIFFFYMLLLYAAFTCCFYMPPCSAAQKVPAVLSTVLSMVLSVVCKYMQPYAAVICSHMQPLYAAICSRCMQLCGLFPPAKIFRVNFSKFTGSDIIRNKESTVIYGLMPCRPVLRLRRMLFSEHSYCIS